jgi:threonine dehydratase
MKSEPSKVAAEVLMIRHVSAPTSEQLEAARRVIADHLVPTPTVTISLRGRPVLAKLECLQPTGSFKVRGALSAVDASRRDDPRGAVITSSAGNHGLGIAHACSVLGVPATVVVPKNASIAKVKKLSQFDIELIQYGSSYDEAQAHALELADSRSIRYISPFNDTNVIAGQATVLDEMLLQAPELEHLVVPVGGGGLLSGMLMSRDDGGRGDLRLTGVQPTESAALYHVLRGATMDQVVHRPTIADGLAGGGDDGAITNELIAKSDVPLVLVPEIEIRRAVREVAENNGLVLEGSASAPYAAITNNLVADKNSRIGFIASGRNISHELFAELLNEPLS